MRSKAGYINVFIAAWMMLTACNDNGGEKNEGNTGKMKEDTVLQPVDPTFMDSNKNKGDTSVAISTDNNDSLLSKLKGLAGMFGDKNDTASGNSTMTILSKLQSTHCDTSADPGNAMAQSLLNFQLGQMGDNNPLKAVAQEMMKAQHNGTARPSKKYTAAYTVEQPTDYIIPVSGTGNVIQLEYTGGNTAGDKKDGLWKNLYIDTKKDNGFNIYMEGYAEVAAINMKVHAASLAGKDEPCSVELNDQYKKYTRQQKDELGKNESGIEVQKAGMEKMFGYDCVHVKITYTVKTMGQTSRFQNDEWYSAGVPGSKFLSPHIFENHSPSVISKIVAVGCTGTLVRSVLTSGNSVQLIQLTEIEQKELPADRFSLPADYKEDKNTTLYDLQ